MIYSACSLPDTFFSPCPSLIHTHTHASTLSISLCLPTGVGLLCKAEWAQKSQRAVCALDSRFTLKSLRLTGTGATNPDSCEGFSPFCQDSDFCRVVWGGRVVGSIDRQGYVLSPLLEDFVVLAL